MTGLSFLHVWRHLLSQFRLLQVYPWLVCLFNDKTQILDKKEMQSVFFQLLMTSSIVINYHPLSLSSQSVFPHPFHPVPQRRFLPSFSWICYSSNSTYFWSWWKPEQAYHLLHQCHLLSEIHSRKHWVTRQGKGSKPVTRITT